MFWRVRDEWPGLDPGRIETALNTLIDRHEMLRAVVTEDGMQRILPEVPRLKIPVIDAAGDFDAAMAEVREDMCHGALDAASWPLFDVRIVTDGETSRLCVVFDNIITDGLSILTLFAEWEPKGVEITHRSALNTLDDLRSRYEVGAADTVLALSAADFDLSVFVRGHPQRRGGRYPRLPRPASPGKPARGELGPARARPRRRARHRRHGSGQSNVA